MTVAYDGSLFQYSVFFASFEERFLAVHILWRKPVNLTILACPGSPCSQVSCPLQSSGSGALCRLHGSRQRRIHAERCSSMEAYLSNKYPLLFRVMKPT